MSRELIVIDTDPGTDDAIALAILQEVVRPEHVAFVSTYGNMPINATHANLRKVISQFPHFDGIYKGAARSLFGTIPSDSNASHGSDGLGGHADDLEDTLGPDVGGVDALADLISTFDSCVYVAIGPLTNLALILRKKAAVEKISEVVMMGGGFEISNLPNGVEYNFGADPFADTLMLSSGLKKTLFPLDFTHAHPLSAGRIAELPSESNSIFRAILEARCQTSQDGGDGGTLLHDAFPILYLANKDAFETETLRLMADVWGSLYQIDTGHAVEVVREMQGDLLFEALDPLFG